MNKKILACLSIIAILSICLTGIVGAAREGYSFSIATGIVTPTINGTHSPADEWNTDSYKDFLYDGWTMTNSFFMDKWIYTETVYEYWLIEILTVTSPFNGDSCYFCCDTLADGGTAPQADDFQITISGHGPSVVTLQQGNGTGWGASSAVLGDDVVVSTSMGTSPASDTPHWIIEIQIDKLGALALQYSNNVMITTWNGKTENELLWPPSSSRNIPNEWGTGETGTETIPEGLTLGVMLAVTSVAAVVGTRYFRKPKL